MGRSSSKREEIYAFLKDYIASHGYPPTTREIMAGVGLRSTASVHYHLSELSRSGAIEMDGGKNRAISLGLRPRRRVCRSSRRDGRPADPRRGEYRGLCAVGGRGRVLCAACARRFHDRGRHF